MVIRYRLRLTTSPNPLTPITHNPDLAGTLSRNDPSGFQTTDWMYLHQWYGPTGLKPLHELCPDRTPTLLEQFRDHQIKAYFQSLPGLRHLARPLTSFEHLCANRTHLTRGISSLYSMLMTQTSGDTW
ncbi:Hypothetical predicted protein, partial [Pelobates cultripes]